MDDVAPRGELLQGERLVISTLRALALRDACPGLQAHFEQACGSAGAQAYWSLDVFVRQLAWHGRRTLALSPPGDFRLTADESFLLDLFGCAQADDYRSLDAGLAQITRGCPPSSMGAAACLVAEILRINGLWLRPDRTSGMALRMAAE